MKQWMLAALLIAGVVVVIAITRDIVPSWRDGRGVRIFEPEVIVESKFDPAQSAGLFIGVSKFTKDQSLNLQFAADDAVDLAHRFALDPRVQLVRPEKVVIALSGNPKKPASKRRLEELIEAGAVRRSAEQTDILLLLQQQAAIAGRDGILIVSIASHGFVREGVPHVLGSASAFQYERTALPTPTLFEIAATSDARRSLFLIDACRERIAPGARAARTAVTAAPLIDTMGQVFGQIVFSAAPAGGFAYDGDGNGVFTKAVLDGLDCKARRTRGFVTFDGLSDYVERDVKAWIRRHRNPFIQSATQASIDGQAKKMPLCACDQSGGEPPNRNISRAIHEGSIVTAFSKSGAILWRREVRGRAFRAEVADLAADGIKEVVVGADTITVFDRDGHRKDVVVEGMTLRDFRVGDLLRTGPAQQIVALLHGPHESSRVAVYSGSAERLSAYDHAGPLTHIVVDRPTPRHDRRIIVAGIDDEAGARLGVDGRPATIFLLHPRGETLWARLLLPPVERVETIETIPHPDRIGGRDIAVSTRSGDRLVLDFSGNIVAGSKSSRLQLKELKER